MSDAAASTSANAKGKKAGPLSPRRSKQKDNVELNSDGLPNWPPKPPRKKSKTSTASSSKVIDVDSD